MKNKRYSEEEISYLIENYPGKTIAELASDLERSEDGVAAKLVTLGLTKGKPTGYSDSEIAFIKGSIGKMTISEMAKKLGRSPSGISKLISKHRITRQRKKAKIFRENIDSDVPPVYSKGSTYYETLSVMKVGESFEFPYADRHILTNQKYIVVNESLLNNRQKMFSIRKTNEVEGVQMARIWRLL